MPIAASEPEDVLDPDLPCIDPHHHVWLQSESRLAGWMRNWPEVGEVVAEMPRFLFEELLENVTSCGHNIVATMYADAAIMYRAEGPEHLRSVGEVEFANGIAAMSASGEWGPVKLCAGIIGEADLRRDDVGETLEALIRAGGGRFRGIRAGIPAADRIPDFAAGARRLRDLGLTCNFWTTEPHLPELIAAVEACPDDLPIIVEHVGAPTQVGEYAGKLAERYPLWEASMRALAGHENVHVQLGALSVPFTGFASWGARPAWTSEQIAAEWAPYVIPAIEMFGAPRCMFESDFPYMAGACTYQVLWNTFKRLAAGASGDEKADLCARTAERVYSLDLW